MIYSGDLFLDEHVFLYPTTLASAFDHGPTILTGHLVWTHCFGLVLTLYAIDLHCE